ncbi:MAG: ribonuclease III [Porticoccaceae bacterium]
MNIGSRQLTQRLGHEFSDPVLLERALTHRSFGAGNNERLEFLGDAVLGMLISQILYRHFDDANEGDLTRFRAQLVNGKSLAGVAWDLGLGRHLRLGQGEMKSGGRRRDSILANSLEAVLGAILLDAGVDACERCVRHWFASRLNALTLTANYKDPKTRLQEHLQGRGVDLPHYDIEQVTGVDHAQLFSVRCSLPLTPEVFTGMASSRRKAEQAAAAKALIYLDAHHEQRR